MDSFGRHAYSYYNWLSKYIEFGTPHDPPLNSRVRTRLWVYHHCFSEFGELNFGLSKEKQQQAGHYYQDRHGNNPEGSKVWRAAAARMARGIVKKYGNMRRRRNPLRIDEERAECSGIRTPAKKPNVKLGDHSSNLISSEETLQNARFLHCAPVSCFEASAAVRECHLLSKVPAKLPASSRKASPHLLSTHQLFYDSFWPEVFKNSTKNLVLDVSMTRVITGGAAPNSMSSSSTVAGSRKRKRDGEYDTLSSNKRLR